MTPTRRLITRLALAVALAAPVAGPAVAAYPEKPITLILPAAAGGPSDTVAQLIAESMSRTLGQSIIVENVAGASGTVGMARVAKSAPDGYTFLVTISTPLWSARALYRKLPYDPDKDLTPVTLFPSGALQMAVYDKLPVKTPKEFIEYARKNKATFGTYSPASLPHMIADVLGRTRGVDIEPIHYKGETPMWVDVAGGAITAGFGSHQAMNAHIQRGNVRPIASWGGRSPKLPDVPTFQELGVTDPIFGLNGWMPMCAPAGTPEDILRKVSGAIAEARQTDKIKQLHETFGIPNVPPSLDEARAIWKKEAPEWFASADRLGIKLD